MKIITTKILLTNCNKLYSNKNQGSTTNSNGSSNIYSKNYNSNDDRYWITIIALLLLMKEKAEDAFRDNHGDDSKRTVKLDCFHSYINSKLLMLKSH